MREKNVYIENSLSVPIILELQKKDLGKDSFVS